MSHLPTTRTTPVRKNIYHEEIKRERTQKILKTFTFLLLFFIITVFAGYFFFASPFFAIQNISISGTKNIQKKAVLDSLDIYKGKNLLLTTIHTTNIKKQFTLIQSITIEKSWVNTLHVTIQEYPPFMLVQTPKSTKVITIHGDIIDTIENTSTKYSLPLVVSNSDSMENVDLNALGNIVYLLEAQKDTFITKFMLTVPYMLTSSYTDGHSIILSLHSDPIMQVGMVNAIKSYMGFSRCKVLDVRFDNAYCSSE